MKRPWLNSRRTLAMLAGLLVVVSLLPARWVRPVSRVPRSAIAAAIAPITNGLKAVSDRLRPGTEQTLSVGDEARTRRLYEEMLARTRQLEVHLQDAQVQLQELSLIRQQRALDPLKLVDASVAAWGVATHTLMISRGQRDGLRNGLVAVDGGSLVGRISHTSRVNSTVRLITLPGTFLLARIVAPDAVDAPHEMEVALTCNDDGQFIGEVRADAPVNEGDLAHLSDETWPAEAAGFIVGRVMSVAEDPADPILRRVITVKPLRPLPRLSRLRVLVPIEQQAQEGRP